MCIVNTIAYVCVYIYIYIYIYYVICTMYRVQGYIALPYRPVCDQHPRFA